MIKVAKNAGFCFGVRRATDTVEELISKSQRGTVFILGKLIHNEQYSEFLKENGVIELDSADLEMLRERARCGKSTQVVIRTHGIEREIQKGLEECVNDTFKIIDSTCPYVKKIHKIATENSGEDSVFILIGKKDHPEVLSIMSYVAGEGYVFKDCGELEEFLERGEADLAKKTVVMAAQTTQKLTEWEKCQKIIKKYCTNAKIFDTICSVTEIRQTEAEALSRECDVMLVVGGKESSNTAKLVQVCSKHCERTYWIQTTRDIPFENIGHENNIGITAGASTPDGIIQEVRKTMSTVMENENFALMLEEEMAKKPKIYVGATVKGVVMAISENEINLDLGDKLTGVITRDQIVDSNDVKLADLFKIGDEVEASVMSKSDNDGIAILSKKKVDSVKNWSKIVELQASGEVIEVKITEATKGGLVANADGVRVFIPASMTGLAKDADLAVLKGTVQAVKIVEIKEDRRSAVASIKAVIREKQKAEAEAFWNELEEGKVFEGPVKSITSYGAFVDLGGVDGLVHITELSWKRIKNPSEVVSVGQILKVFVKSFDKENKKISLGHKTEEENPWNIFKSQYNVGDVAKVKIVGVTTFGAFAQIVPGVDGLIHISQIADQKIESVANMLKVGDEVDALIKEVDDEKQKVSLSMRALLETSEEAEAEVEAEVEAEATEEEAAE